MDLLFPTPQGLHSRDWGRGLFKDELEAPLLRETQSRGSKGLNCFAKKWEECVHVRMCMHMCAYVCLRGKRREVDNVPEFLSYRNFQRTFFFPF